jgi:hypothetical protein
VTNAVTGQITTLGVMSNGILAQSIGGGGGNAGGVGTTGTTIGFATTVGGSAGAVGSGGEVTVDNAAEIATYGAASQAIAAQSIGGGGGNAGVGGSFNAASNGRTITVGIGGSSSGGGNGGAVNVTNSATGAIYTYGLDSTAIFAQSVGGGGGAAAFSGALNISGGDLNNTVGGAGAGGAGGNVTVISTGSITTLSPDSVGVSAQSIGGGGGSGTFSIPSQLGSLGGSFLKIGGSGSGTQGANGKVIVKVSGGTTTTAGDLSYGVLSQAIGAGGGNGALSVPDPLTIGAGGSSQTVGASGAISGDGNPLNTQNANVILTTGAGSLGFAGQSIGGGGGTSGVTGDVTFTAAGPLSVTAGGSSSGGGSGGPRSSPTPPPRLRRAAGRRPQAGTRRWDCWARPSAAAAEARSMRLGSSPAPPATSPSRLGEPKAGLTTAVR